MGLPEDPHKGPIYPSIDPTQLSLANYKPADNTKGGVSNPF